MGGAGDTRDPLGAKPDPTGAVGLFLPSELRSRQGNSREARTGPGRTRTGPGIRPPWPCGGHRPRPCEEAARAHTHACAHASTRGTRTADETWCQLSAATLSSVFPGGGGPKSVESDGVCLYLQLHLPASQKAPQRPGALGPGALT